MKFSQLYLPPAELVRDSLRMRTRISAYLKTKNYDTDALALRISSEIGINVPQSYTAFNFDAFFTSAEVKDVLDSITVIYEELQERSKGRRPTRNDSREFTEFVNKVFKEEGLAYIMEVDGSVKFLTFSIQFLL